MKQKKTVEDYLKAIYTISKRKKVHGADIADQLKVSRPTVSVALRALSEEGYLFLDDKTREVHLTDRGKEIAGEMERSVYMVRNRIAELTRGGYLYFHGRGGHGEWVILKELPDKEESFRDGGW